MTDYEMLLDSADSQNVTVDETSHFCGTQIKGLYLDNHIALSKDLRSDTQKRCILAEELGHYHTTVGDIIGPPMPTASRSSGHVSGVTTN